MTGSSNLAIPGGISAHYEIYYKNVDYHRGNDSEDNEDMKSKLFWDLNVVIQVSNDDISTTLKKTHHARGNVVRSLL